MLLSLFALSILFIPFTLTEATWWPPVFDTHAQYGLNLTFAGWLKSGTVRYIEAAFGSPEEAASTAHTRQIWPKEARFCEAAYRPPERVWALKGTIHSCLEGSQTIASKVRLIKHISHLYII